jgi:hypothetical protein
MAPKPLTNIRLFSASMAALYVLLGIGVHLGDGGANAEVLITREENEALISDGLIRPGRPTTCLTGKMITDDQVLIDAVNHVLKNETGWLLTDVSDFPTVLFVEDCGSFLAVSTVLGEFTSGRVRKIIFENAGFPFEPTAGYLFLPP